MWGIFQRGAAAAKPTTAVVKPVTINVKDIVERLAKVAHDPDTRKFDNVVEGLQKQYRLEESTLQAWAKEINAGRQGQIAEEMTRAIEIHGADWQKVVKAKHWVQDAEKLAEVTGAKALGRGAKAAAGKTWGGIKNVGKWTGIGAAALVGAGVLSAYLSGKREASAEAMANEPPQPPMQDFNPSFGPAYAEGPTGSTPPVEGDFVARYAKGGEMNRTAMPATPDVASRAQAIEQSRAEGAVPSLAG
jgi:hypothetical protein